LDVSLF